MGLPALKEKACNRCGVLWPHTEEFYRFYCKSGSKPWQQLLKAICRVCERKAAAEYNNARPEKMKANAKKRYAENKERDPLYARRVNIQQKYGISQEEYETMLSAQHGNCAICNRHGNVLHANGRPQALAIDHDHETGAIRGLLCSLCNQGLGSFQDNGEFLLNAARYLKGANHR